MGRQPERDPDLFPDDFPEVTVPSVDRCVRSYIGEDHAFSAASVVASVGDRVFHRGIYGNPTHPPPVKRLGHDTLFDVASLTKPLATGLAALLLVSRNRLDMHAPLSRTLKEFRNIPKFEQVTVDMLLDHTSGFPAHRKFYNDIAEADTELPEKERVLGSRQAAPAMREMLAMVQMQADPGTKTIYSDLNFLALGWIIEELVNRPLDDFLLREIYRPLGVHEQLFFVRHDDPRQQRQLFRKVFAATEQCEWRDKLIQGEVHDQNAWALGGVAGHAGLFGTGDAVWHVMRTLWRCYRGESRFFLGGTVKRFWNRSRRVRDTTRTLAWDTPTANNSAVSKRFSMNSVGHLGFTGCSVWLDLNTDVIAVVLTNAAHPSPEGKKEQLEKFRPRVHELIAKHGESLPPERKTGAAAFSDTVLGASRGGRGPWGKI